MVSAAAFATLCKKYPAYTFQATPVSEKQQGTAPLISSVMFDTELVECAKKSPLELVPPEYHEFMDRFELQGSLL